MNIGLDFDDTITRHPEFFAALTAAMRQAGHKVYIITFRDEADAKETVSELDQWHIVYDAIHYAPVFDLQWKANKCRELGVTVFFEDMPEVVNLLPDILCLMPVDHVLGNVAYTED
jgi:hypothetical protein